MTAMLMGMYVLLIIVFLTLAYQDKIFQNHQVLGVTLSTRAAESTEVKRIADAYWKGVVTGSLLLGLGSLGMLLEPMRKYSIFYIFILTFALMGMIYFFARKGRNALKALKEEKDWVYAPKKYVMVDTKVLREMGKSAVWKGWVWIFFALSFLPFIYGLLRPEIRDYFPLPALLTGPLIQGTMVALYYLALKEKAPALSADSEVNKICARIEERIRTGSAVMVAGATFLFWIALLGTILLEDGSGWILPLVMAFTVAVMAIGLREQRIIQQTERRLFKEEYDADLTEEENHWWYGLYRNPEDPRLFVPKRIPGMGQTINVAHPGGKIFLGGTLLLTAGILVLVMAGEFLDYEVVQEGRSISIQAPFYDTSFDIEGMEEVELLEDLPKGIRTNGFGGVTKSFGYFTIEGYGPVRLYAYNDVDPVIYIKLREGKSLFVNGKTLEDTQRLYEFFKERLP